MIYTVILVREDDERQPAYMDSTEADSAEEAAEIVASRMRDGDDQTSEIVDVIVLAGQHDDLGRASREALCERLNAMTTEVLDQPWTTADAGEAAAEGWVLADANTGWCDIERDEEADLDLFQSDLHALLHVVGQAVRSDDPEGLHYRALVHWKEVNPVGYRESVRFILDGIPALEE